MIPGFLQDVRYASRMIASRPGFTAVAVLTLALGVGATAAIFSFVDAVLLRPLPYEDSDRIVLVSQRTPSGSRSNVSALNYLDWRRGSSVFEHLAAFTRAPVTLTGLEEPMMVRGARVSTSYFDVFRVGAFLGRTFRPGEDEPGKDAVAIISHRLWTSQFAADPRVLGRSLTLDGTPSTIIGVLPPGSAFDRDVTQIWRPLTFTPAEQTRDFNWLRVVGRLAAGASLENATREMDVIARRLAHDFPESNKGLGVMVDPYGDTLVGLPLRRSLSVLLGAAGVLLVLVCANVANLMLIGGTRRQSEVALRIALGAARLRLVRQFLTEAMMLSALGALVGFLLGYGLMLTMQQLIPPLTLPSDVRVTMNLRVITFIAVVSLSTGTVFGMVPALRCTRPDLAEMLTGSGRTSANDSSRRIRNLLVVVEVAVAFALLAGVGLLGRSFYELMRVETGFDETNVVTMGLPIPETRFADGEQLSRYVRDVVDAINRVPGVREAAATSALPMRGWGFGLPFRIAGRPAVDAALRDTCFFKMVSPSYFSALGIRLVRGRRLSALDLKGSPPSVVINEAMAARFFKGEEPIGQRILIQEVAPAGAALGPEIPWQVVGIVANEKVTTLDDTSPGVYVSVDQSPTPFMNLVVRARVDPATLARAIGDGVRKVSGDQPLPEMRTLTDIKTTSTAAERLRTSVLLAFALVAMVLAAVGIYGVISYSVAQRTREIGIRTALGAHSGAIARSVIGHGLALACGGLILGSVAALALTRLLTGFLFGVTAMDPATFVGAALLLMTVAAAACYLPARRAARLDPLTALRRLE